MSIKKNNEPKVAIIGAGPSGLTAAIYTSRAMLDTTVFTGNQPGGQLTTTTEIENFPGAWNIQENKGLMGPELMEIIQKQAQHFGAKIIYENVKNLYKLENNKFKIVTDKEYVFDAVIIASGASARYLNTPNEEKFIGQGYHSCATCDGFFYRNKIVGVVGGGDSAMEESNFLTKFAEKVYIIHRSSDFKASKIMLERAKNNPKIEFLTNKQVTQLKGDNSLDFVTLEDTITKEQTDLKLDGLFVAIGHIPNSDFIGDLLDKEASGYLIPNFRLPQENRVSKYNMGTKIPGIFVAGDIQDTYYKQAITASGDGCRAAIECKNWLDSLEK